MPMDEVQLRPASAQDCDFLYQLHKATMQTYVAQTWGWDEEWQQAYFRQHFDPSVDQIVVFAGKDIGVLSVDKREREVRVAKIEILPEYQKQGIGTGLIDAVLEGAFREGLPVTLQVLKANPRIGWYERLGFRVVGETQTHYLMVAMPFNAGPPSRGASRQGGCARRIAARDFANRANRSRIPRHEQQPNAALAQSAERALRKR